MNLIPYKNELRFFRLDDSFTTYGIVSGRETPIVMMQFAQSRWSFPMTLYFESYPFEKEDILKVPLPIKQMVTKKKIISLSPKGIHREHLPTFIVNIENEKMLEKAFEEFFYVAQQNLFFTLANKQCLIYKGHHVAIKSEEGEFLLADYDGKAAIYIANSKEEHDA